MFRLILEGFRWFEIAVNNTHLSQRATWRCSRRTSSFSPFVVCRLECSPWSRRAEFEAAASLAWPSPCTCRLMIFVLRAPQFDAPHVCIVLSSVSSTTNVRHSGMFQFVSSCSGYFSCFFLFSLFVVGFLVCQVVPVFLACCVKCYCVFHGCSLFSECLWVSSWGSLMVWCCFRLLWHVAICLYRLLIAVCRFLCFFFCIVLSRLGSSRCLALFYIIVGRLKSLVCIRLLKS